MNIDYRSRRRRRRDDTIQNSDRERRGDAQVKNKVDSF
ncbi:unnamed protein product [Rhodiola kirilowii]